ncbi:MAG: bifunctional adenosylcobinamide kinase/adenosylcobinamide-phosphate guanylyltransferase [Hyphomicrobiales bacterium]|nr:bifunctional adenosylcobinamide kinase/adenosylcobinamide-phosphate guanylyltransferase [Hyphomicrobiales bacterium]
MADAGQRPPDLFPLLVLGGARSGKSSVAQAIAEASGLVPLYVATGEAGDSEMAARIARHREARGSHWLLHEEPLDLVGALAEAAQPGRIILIDCATLWLSNLMQAGRDLDAEGAALTAALRTAPCPIIIVSNEVGQGIVPENALARRFRDAQGRLNQRLAAQCPRVMLVVAGLSLPIKPSSRL